MLPLFVYIFGSILNLLVIVLITISYTTDIIPAFGLLEVIVFVLALGYFDFIIIEKALTTKRRNSFKYVIHVNGIRGKSTTTRLIDAGLRNLGYKVYTKTTGTLPYIINTNNEDVKVERTGNANIREQIKMINNAHKENADILVLECMAVNPELQYVCERQILEADVTVITNVRLDHVQDMGDNLEDIAYAFCNTIPTNGHLVVNDSEFVKLFKEKAKELGTTVHVAKPYENEDTLDTFAENIAVALEVARVLNLDLDLFFEGMKNYHHDFGAFSKHKVDNTLFLNGLSINDPESIKYVYDQITKEYGPDKITILLNNRGDRPTRVLQHIELLSNINCKKILLIGSNLSYVKKNLEKKLDIEIEVLENIEDLKKEDIILLLVISEERVWK